MNWISSFFVFSECSCSKIHFNGGKMQNEASFPSHSGHSESYSLSTCSGKDIHIKYCFKWSGYVVRKEMSHRASSTWTLNNPNRFAQDIAFFHNNEMSACVCVNTFHFALQLIKCDRFSFFFFCLHALVCYAHTSIFFSLILQWKLSTRFLHRMLHLPKSTFTSFSIARILLFFFVEIHFCHSRASQLSEWCVCWVVYHGQYFKLTRVSACRHFFMWFYVSFLCFLFNRM